MFLLLKHFEVVGIFKQQQFFQFGFNFADIYMMTYKLNLSLYKMTLSKFSSRPNFDDFSSVQVIFSNPSNISLLKKESGVTITQLLLT